MKILGMSRKVDELGRIVIPKELRRTMGIDNGTPMEIFVEDEIIILRKFSSAKACMITGEILHENKEYSGGITLSPAGAKQILEILKTK